MKRKWLILFFGFLMASCTSSVETRLIASQNDVSPNQQLQAIDSLMWRQPDSALMLLVDFAASPQADSPSTFDGHYFQMLLSELLYKNDCEQTNRAELLEAVDYFDSLTTVLSDTLQPRSRHCGLGPQSPGHYDNLVFLDARAHYINGVGYYERDSVVEACAEYLKALEAMEEQFEEKELVGVKSKFMTYSYGRLAELFSNQYMMDNSITCYEKSLNYCQRTPTSTIGISRIQYQIGKQYAMLNDNEQALSFYEQAVKNMPYTDNGTYRDIQSHIVMCRFEMGTAMNESVEILRQLIAQADKPSERFHHSLYIGSIYAEEKVYDSALAYLEPLFENEGEVEAAKCLRVIYDSLGYTEKADACVRFLAENIPSEGENKALVSELHDLFQKSLNQRQMQQIVIEKRQTVLKTLNWVIPIIVFLILGLIVAMRHRHRKRMKAEQEKHRIEQKALSGRLKRSNQELIALKEQVQQKTASVFQPQAESFFDEPVCRLIMERVNERQFKAKVDYAVYKDSALDKQQLFDLRLAADRHFNQFTVRLKQAYPKLTNSDLDYCCLYLLGLTDADVSALMQKAYPTISQRSRKIKAIMGNGSAIPITLRDFANCNL